MSRLIWTAYAVMAAEGFVIVAIGFITPFVSDTLHVDPWIAAMPNSMMAVGMGVGGLLARRANARLGPDHAARAWILLVAVSAVLLAAPMSIFVTILGGFLFGTSQGAWLVHVNSALGRGEGGARRLTRAHLSASLGGLGGPLILALVATSIGWWYGAIVPVPFLLALAFLTPGSPARDVATAGSGREPPLSSSFWIAWVFLALCVGSEFSYVVWGSQVVATRTGISIAAATGLASLFLVGMVGGRMLAGVVHLKPRRQLLALRAGTALAAFGAILMWSAGRPEVAAIGLLCGGLGLSALYPFGASLALTHAPNAPVHASARLTLASSVAIFGAPLLLGLVAGAVGILGAWMIVVALLMTAFVLVTRMRFGPAAATGAMRAAGGPS